MKLKNLKQSKVDSTKTVSGRISRYSEGKEFFVKVKKELYKVVPLSLASFTTTKLYSLPHNTYHEPWTCRKYIRQDNLQKNKDVFQHWSLLKPGLYVRGIIKDNTFIIRHIDYERDKSTIKD